MYMRPCGQRVDLGAVHVEPEHPIRLLGKGQRERQADVPETDDADEGRAVLDLSANLRRDRRSVQLHFASSVPPDSFLSRGWRAPPPSVYAPKRVRTDWRLAPL